jgi:hypothetical protein
MNYFGTNLEDRLREALRRQDPPEGFAERVIQQAGPARAQALRIEPKWRMRRLWPAVSFAAAAAAVMFSITVENRHRQEEEAGRQAILALRIASQKLNMVRDKVLNK